LLTVVFKAVRLLVQPFLKRAYIFIKINWWDQNSFFGPQKMWRLIKPGVPPWPARAKQIRIKRNFGITVKPVLTATSEQRPPVNNDQPKFPALIITLQLYQVFWTNLWTTATLWTTVTFSGSQGWPLYTGLTV